MTIPVMKKPDFKNLKNILLCRDRKYVPICELLVEDEIKEKILSRPVSSIGDEIDFCLAAGYDFIGISSGILKPTKTLAQMSGTITDRWAEENRGDIYSDCIKSHKTDTQYRFNGHRLLFFMDTQNCFSGHQLLFYRTLKIIYIE